MNALPTTCKDFVSHPHIVEGRGCYTCQEANASEEQGTTQSAHELRDLGIKADVHQTGGFTMCAYVDLGNGFYIYANTYGASVYSSDDYESDIAQFDEPQSAEAIAQMVSDYISKR